MTDDTHYCETHGLRFRCPQCAADEFTGGKCASELEAWREDAEQQRAELDDMIFYCASCTDGSCIECLEAARRIAKLNKIMGYKP